ncbi:MAG: hypothetical protein K0R38_7468 [Polyangiaceae bacterium]|jgi:hypothetical protein|nr:hypothetical protein [Polyangiaceae bacterium]
MTSKIAAVFVAWVALGCGVSKESVRINAQGILSQAYPIRGGRAQATADSIIKKSFALCKAADLDKQACCALVLDEFKTTCEQEYAQ